MIHDFVAEWYSEFMELIVKHRNLNAVNSCRIQNGVINSSRVSSSVNHAISRVMYTLHGVDRDVNANDSAITISLSDNHYILPVKEARPVNFRMSSTKQSLDFVNEVRIGLTELILEKISHEFDEITSSIHNSETASKELHGVRVAIKNHVSLLFQSLSMPHLQIRYGIQPGYTGLPCCISDGIPDMPAVYIILSTIGIKYIGQTKNLYRRILHHKHYERGIDIVSFFECTNRESRLCAELMAIQSLSPLNNKAGKIKS